MRRRFRLKPLIVIILALSGVLTIYIYVGALFNTQDIVAMADDLRATPMSSKNNIYQEFMEVETKESIRATNTVDIVGNQTINVSVVGEYSGITLGNYLELYKGPTVTAIGRVVEVGKLMDIESRSRNSWYMCEGLSNHEGKLPNKWASPENGGNLVYNNFDSWKMIADGRYLVAVGPGVMIKEFKTGDVTDVTAIDMQYGCLIDVVIKDKEGTEYYVPCIVACTKAHTYPTGVIQSGVKRLKKDLPSGEHNLEDYSANHNDGSIVEFCASREVLPMSEMGKYTIERIIVYDGVYNLGGDSNNA